jgi:hypothetical protein
VVGVVVGSVVVGGVVVVGVVVPVVGAVVPVVVVVDVVTGVVPAISALNGSVPKFLLEIFGIFAVSGAVLGAVEGCTCELGGTTALAAGSSLPPANSRK